MDIQGYISRSEGSQVLHYANVVDRYDLSPSPEFRKRKCNTPLLTPSHMPTILSTLPEYEVAPNEHNPDQPVSYASSSSSLKPHVPDNVPQSLNPALLRARSDKRKSSPAVLGLPLGLSNDQLDLHLSQPRNSIEAAMLLANFNRLPTFLKSSSDMDNKGTTSQWQDDISIAAQTQEKNTWDGEEALVNESDAMRRHSYDVNMSWNTMPQEFLDRADFLQDLPMNSSGSDLSQPSFTKDQTSMYYNEPNTASAMLGAKVTWTQDGMMQEIQPTEYNRSMDFMPHPTSTRPPPQQQPAILNTSFPEVRNIYSSSFTPPMYAAANRYPPPGSLPHPYHPQQPERPPQPAPMLHPLARTPEMAGQKRDHPHDAYYSYSYPTGPTGPIHPQYFQSGKLPLPSPSSVLANPMVDVSSSVKPRRKKNRTDADEDDSIEAAEHEFPEMYPRDLEAARTDPEARPRKQKLRFPDDRYTPQWVRYNGQAKEGLCDTCKPGKWLQLKNSAYWYHKQFYHGISSVSGREFVQPLETRWVDQDLVEGLCHQCRQWVAVSNVKRKNSVLWYRHAHKCHVYHKPKNTPKKR
ncbi:hypothetical protein DFQ28_011240 [Apophysomyces sp. BC1034]|nr:hypothetical protein DFQ30_007054 [Apophysomyces sp. BC1015]KAG0181452.1 hypothetical protein DFQ29_008234 [Apophysomyces sp. BC1021]KAG0194439.1 hypothetical protein DFQ28_011240 [Apophysomyces sp. BC1034]